MKNGFLGMLIVVTMVSCGDSLASDGTRVYSQTSYIRVVNNSPSKLTSIDLNLTINNGSQVIAHDYTFNDLWAGDVSQYTTVVSGFTQYLTDGDVWVVNDCTINFRNPSDNHCILINKSPLKTSSVNQVIEIGKSYDIVVESDKVSIAKS